MLWGVLACVAILPTTGYYWSILEPPGTYTTLGFSWMCPPPIPDMYGCTDVQLPPLSYNTFTCSGDLWGVPDMRWHSPYYWILLEHIGTTWNLYDPMRTVLDSPGCARAAPRLVKKSESLQFLSARSVPCE